MAPRRDTRDPVTGEMIYGGVEALPPDREYNPMSAVPGQAPTVKRTTGQRFASAIQGPGTLGVSMERQIVDEPGVRDARWYQNQVIQALQRQAAGDMNSQAQQQLRDSFQRARAQQASLGSTMRGQSAGAAMRSIQAGQQGISRGQTGEEQMLKLQEQEAARAMLAQLLAQQQGLDIRQAGIGSDYRLGDASLSDIGLRGGLSDTFAQMMNQSNYDITGRNIRSGLAADDAQRRGQQIQQGIDTGAGALATLASVWKKQNTQDSGTTRSQSIIPEGDL